MSNQPSPERIHERPRVTSEIPPDGPMAGLDRDIYYQPGKYLVALSTLLDHGLPEFEEPQIKHLPRSQDPMDRLRWLFASRQDLAIEFDTATEGAFTAFVQAEKTQNPPKLHSSETEKKESAARRRIQRVSVYVGRVSAWQARPKKLRSVS